VGYGAKKASGVCKNVFSICYNVRDTYIEGLCAEIKKGYINSDDTFTDKNNKILSANSKKELDALQQIVAYSNEKGLKLSFQQLAASVIPNSDASLNAYAWMKNYFRTTGDDIPNSGEIHLEPILIKTVHKEYKETMIEDHMDHLELSQFGTLWTTCFPYVKIREFKAVTGKCNTCALLSIARRKYRGRDHRLYVTRLYELHRSAYMNERIAYATRSMQANLFPKEYLSMNSDGMAQIHCRLPWMANVSSFKQHLPQPIQ
jgi:hypothetical protein